ncbi:unnamed protein product [Rhizophagus irregularis]|nr:unnamed protein product [Rhizophagus irregularis]
MESVFDLLREENARLMAKITGQASSFEKAELKTKNAKLRKRFAKLEEKQLENLRLKSFQESNISRSEHKKITLHFALHSLQFITMASELSSIMNL